MADDDEGFREIQAHALFADLGGVVIFEGETRDGNTVRFAVDNTVRRGVAGAAQSLVNRIEFDGPVWCEVPEWAILRTFTQPTLGQET